MGGFHSVAYGSHLFLVSAGLTIVANVAIATGPALLGAPRSSVINLIYYIIYKMFFILRSHYCANFAISSKRSFQLNAVCVQKFLFDSFVQVGNKRHKIAVSTIDILAELLLNLAGFSHC